MKTITIIILVVFISIFVIPSKLNSELSTGVIVTCVVVGIVVVIIYYGFIFPSFFESSVNEGNYHNGSLSYQAGGKTANDFYYRYAIQKVSQDHIAYTTAQEYQTDVSRDNNKSMAVLSLSF